MNNLSKLLITSTNQIGKCKNEKLWMNYPINLIKKDSKQIINSKDQKLKTNLEMRHGTTTVAFIYQGGAIVAVDSRSSSGDHISSNKVKKVIEINNYLLGTMAGGAADCAFWERVLGVECRIFELIHGQRITVCAASKILLNLISKYRGAGLCMGTMLIGWDRNGPQIYYVDDRCNRINGNLFAVGSGSTYAYGILDNEYKWDLSDNDAIELGKRAIYHASHRDAASGGSINMYIVRKEKWEYLGNLDFQDVFDHYQKVLK